MTTGTAIIGYIRQPGLVDVQYMARNVAQGARGIIVSNIEAVYTVKIRALHGDVELIETKNIKKKVKELEAILKARGYRVVIKDLWDVRDGMRDPM